MYHLCKFDEGTTRQVISYIYRTCSKNFYQARTRSYLQLCLGELKSVSSPKLELQYLQNCSSPVQKYLDEQSRATVVAINSSWRCVVFFSTFRHPFNLFQYFYFRLIKSKLQNCCFPDSLRSNIPWILNWRDTILQLPLIGPFPWFFRNRIVSYIWFILQQITPNKLKFRDIYAIYKKKKNMSVKCHMYLVPIII